MTDDETEFEADEERVVRALQGADTVMSVLLVPNVMRRGMPRGGSWGGVVIHGPNIPGRRGPVGGRRFADAFGGERGDCAGVGG